MTLLLLCWEFFKTGLLSVGGGLATLPFLMSMSQRYPEWFSASELADMIAVAEATPGPIGINMSTFAGYRVAGLPGALLATFSIVLPSLIVIVIIAAFLGRFSENKYVKRVFFGLRPAVAGLIGAAAFTVIRTALLTGEAFSGFSSLLKWLDWRAALMFAVIFALLQIKKINKLHPIVLIGAGAAAGILFQL